MTSKLFFEEQPIMIRVCMRQADSLMAEPCGEFEKFDFPINGDEL
jgi:hypothetical protein